MLNEPTQEKGNPSDSLGGLRCGVLGALQHLGLALEHPWVGRELGARAQGRDPALSFPPPGAPRGDRAEVSQLSTTVICDLLSALTPPGAETRGIPAGCNVPGVLIPAAGKLPPSVRRLAAVGGECRDCWPRSSPPCQPGEGKPCRKLRHRPGRGAMLSPPSQHSKKHRSREIPCQASAGLPWLDAEAQSVAAACYT